MKLAKKNKGKLLLGGSLVLAVVIATAVLLSGGAGVETVQVQRGDIVRTVEDTGYVQSATNYDLHAVQSARVVQVPAQTGDRVKRGQTLVVLENLDLTIQVSDTRSRLAQTTSATTAAQAAVDRIGLELDNARENLERQRELFEADALPRTDYDEALLRVETLEQSLKEQKSLLESSRAQEEGLKGALQDLGLKEQQLLLKSPVDGTVLSLPAKEEQAVNPGTLLATVAVADKLEIKADILSDDLGEVTLGQRVRITAPVLASKTLTGEVVEIYPRAEEKQSALGVIQRRVPVIIALEDHANLKPGYEVRVAIETSTRRDTMIVPRETVRTLGDGGKEVMVVSNRRVAHKPVQVGLGDRENLEILEGLEFEEVIIRDGNLPLKEGARVKPVEAGQN